MKILFIDLSMYNVYQQFLNLFIRGALDMLKTFHGALKTKNANFKIQLT